MVSVLRTVIFALALAGGGLVWQLPEFAQQYRQRLGGALGEIQRIVSDFDKDAQRSNLSREEALALYGRSAEPFIRDRGLSMSAVLERHEALKSQVEALEGAGPLFAPMVVLSAPDNELVDDTWAAFAPALPLGFAGIFYALCGFAVVGGMAGAISSLIGRRRRAAASGPSN